MRNPWYTRIDYIKNLQDFRKISLFKYLKDGGSLSKISTRDIILPNDKEFNGAYFRIYELHNDMVFDIVRYDGSVIEQYRLDEVYVNVLYSLDNSYVR